MPGTRANSTIVVGFAAQISRKTESYIIMKALTFSRSEMALLHFRSASNSSWSIPESCAARLLLPARRLFSFFSVKKPGIADEMLSFGAVFAVRSVTSGPRQTSQEIGRAHV